MALSDKCDFERRQGATQTFGHGGPLYRETFRLALLSTNVSEAQKVERLTATPTLPFASGCATAAELDQAGLVGVQVQAKLVHPGSQGIQADFGVLFMLKANDKIVRVADNYALPFGMSLTPLVNPQVENIVKENVGK